MWRIAGGSAAVGRGMGGPRSKGQSRAESRAARPPREPPRRALPVSLWGRRPRVNAGCRVCVCAQRGAHTRQRCTPAAAEGARGAGRREGSVAWNHQWRRPRHSGQRPRHAARHTPRAVCRRPPPRNPLDGVAGAARSAASALAWVCVHGTAALGGGRCRCPGWVHTTSGVEGRYTPRSKGQRRPLACACVWGSSDPGLARGGPRGCATPPARRAK